MEAMHEVAVRGPGAGPGWRARATLAVLCLTLLAGLGVYAVRVGPSLGTYYHDCMWDPARWAGHETMIATSPVLWAEPGRFAVASKAGEAVVLGGAPGLAPGRYVDVRGVLRADGTVEASAIHVHYERTFKVWGSLAALIVVCVLFVRAVLWPLVGGRRA